jgi:hypothetical protein
MTVSDCTTCHELMEAAAVGIGRNLDARNTGQTRCNQTSPRQRFLLSKKLRICAASIANAL